MDERIVGLGDPFEGRGAARRARRLRVEGIIALGLAITAAGLTAATWIAALAPVRYLFGIG